VWTYLENVASHWSLRDRLTNAPKVSLGNLVSIDEKLEAYVDGLRVTAPKVPADVLENLAGIEAGTLFAVTALAASINDAQLWAAAIYHAAPTVPENHGDSIEPPGGCLREFTSGVAWAGRAATASLIDDALLSPHPLRRSLGLAVWGARRLSGHINMAPFIADAVACVRARAYRTTGQLGRADLVAQLRPGLTDPDPECRFWSAWAAARMGATEPLETLADIAWNNLPRADRALDLLLRRLDVPQANAWLREFAKLPDRQRALIRATGVIGDPLYIPWLIERMADPATARLAGESFCMITGLDLAYRDLDRRPPADFQSGPNDDPADENVALDEDENLPWPDPQRIGAWWTANRSRFIVGTPYFLGTPKASADWLEALSDAFQRQRHAAALELAIRQPDKAMFEVRARGRLQRQLIARARGLA
jgi:uncharacterized protein (TIGR02270 family)